MTLQVRIAGPGLDLVLALEPGGPAIVLGRDPDCDVCLPDPDKTLSRRHLGLWNAADELHFEVLSSVNAVHLPYGDAGPGTVGRVPPGQSVMLGDYTVFAARAAAAPPPPPPPADDDPWAVLEREAGALASEDPTVPGVEDDPFGDWGFDSTFGPGSPQALAAAAAATAPVDISAFFIGMGLDPARVGALAPGELEEIGRLTRMLLMGLLQVHAMAEQLKGELNAEDRTRVGTRASLENPLKLPLSDDSKLHYLFGGREASTGLVGPEHALAELLTDLIAHEGALAAATRASVEGALREFEPESLKARLVGGGRLFEGARAWDAFAKHYAERKPHLSQWAQELLDRYFAEAYLRENMRIQRELSDPQG